MYVIVDIETTGSVATQDRITEIAIFKHDGEKVIDQYNTFVNPERSIPPFITKLTGITNEMVKDAPKFFEVAKEIIEFTEGCVFVAHNVNFDYSFMKKEFNYLGYTYQRKTLCTVRLSRKLIPGETSYSLGKLSKSLGIELPPELRHRAIGDAKATADLFTMLMERSSEKGQLNLFETELKKNLLPPNVSSEIIDELPQETGVYYFHDKDGNVIYVGKSKNIKNRVTKHFSVDFKSKKSIEFKNNIHTITYELTGSELVALLFESAEIKSLLPKYNKAQRRSAFPLGLFSKVNSSGYKTLYIERITKVKNQEPMSTFGTTRTANSILLKLIQEHRLCENLTNLGKPDKNCILVQIKKCDGACAGQEDVDQYNKKVQVIIDKYANEPKNFIVLGRGRRFDESSIVIIENGIYRGFGYIEKDEAIHSIEDAKNYITEYPDNRDVRQIIKNYIKKSKADKILKF